jgi:branched-chain amino acid transport system permease protein
VNIDRIITATFIIGGVLAGVAGLLYGLRFNTRFDIGFIPGIKAFTAAVLGGIGNIRGALVGGIVLGLMENIGAGCFGDQWKNVIAFGVLVLVLMFRPTGLLGEGVSAQKA